MYKETLLKSSFLEHVIIDFFIVNLFSYNFFLGTELPKTRTTGNTTRETCEALRESVPCLEVSCRMGCDYGFLLDSETGCPTCQCRDPCDGVTCKPGNQCQPVEVACVDGYCPPVPACK